MTRDIVVFETQDEQLDFRLVRQSLPAGAAPLAIVENGKAMVTSGQFFDSNDVLEFARTQSGYPLPS